MDKNDEMKYTVGTIFRLFKSAHGNPSVEFIIVDRERMVSKRDPDYRRDMYMVKYTITYFNKTDGWVSDYDIENLNNSWMMEIHNA